VVGRRLESRDRRTVVDDERCGRQVRIPTLLHPGVDALPPLEEPDGPLLRVLGDVLTVHAPPREAHLSIHRQPAPEVPHTRELLEPGVSDEEHVGMRGGIDGRERTSRAGR
jgi:hypothetical protein